MRIADKLAVVLMCALLFTNVSVSILGFANAWNKTKPTVVFFFDDGYESTYTEAYPVLKNRGLKADFCITTDFVNGTFESQDVMSWEQIADLSNDGWGVHSHGASNISANELNASEIQRYVYDSRDYIVGNTSADCLFYVYAGGTGFNNASIVEKVRDYYFGHRVVLADDGGASGTEYNVSDSSLWFDPDTVSLFSATPSLRVDGYDIGVSANRLNISASDVGIGLIDNVIENATSADVCVLLFHHIQSNPRDEPYCDMDLANFTLIIDHAVNESDNGNLFISTLSSVFSQRRSLETVDSIVPVVVTIALSAGVIGMAKKFGSKR
jgi:peptidoglycan/xylan/chitin deacetylase (PgdA/CDA1 family)